MRQLLRRTTQPRIQSQPSSTSTVPGSQTMEGVRHPELSTLPKLGWIGIDIQSDVIRFAQLVNSRGKLQARTSVIEVPDDIAGSIDRADWLDQQVSFLVQELGWRDAVAACVLPRLGYQEDIIDLTDDLSDDAGKLRSLVCQRLNANETQLTIDWWNQASEDQSMIDGHRRYNYVAVRNEFAARHLRSLQHAGLTIACLDSPGFVAARLLQLQEISSNESPVIVLEVTRQVARMSFVFQGVPIYARTLTSLGWDEVCAEVAANLDLSPSQARVVLNRYSGQASSMTRDQRTIQRMLHRSASEYRSRLGRELCRSIGYVDQKLRLASVAKCFVTGIYARQSLLIEALSELMEVETAKQSLQHPGWEQMTLPWDEWGTSLSLSWLGYLEGLS